MLLNNRTIGYLSILAAAIFLAVSSGYIYFNTIHGFCYRIAYSNDIGNLKLDNKLKVSGMEVGRVQDLRRDGNRARILLRMRKDIIIHTGYIFQNRDYGLMGDRALFLEPGITGDTIPVDSPLAVEFIPGIAEGIRNADSLKVIVNRLQVLIQEYNQVDPGNDSLFTTQIKQVLQSLDRASLSLEKMVVAKEPVITANIRKAGDISRQARTTLHTLAPKAENAINKTQALSRDAIAMLEKVGPPLDSLNALLEETVQGKNLAGRAIADKDFYPKLINSIKKLRKVLGTVKDDGIGLDIDIF